MKPFTELTTLQAINECIERHQLVFLYFTTPNCSVCHGLLPQIERILARYPHIRTARIDASIAREAAGQFSIFTAPVLLLFVDGKEYIREARIVHTAQLDKQIARIYENVVDNSSSTT